MLRPAFDDRHDLSCGLNCAGMTGIQETAWCDQFGFSDRGMPRIRGSNCNLAGFRKTALQDVHVNGRIVEECTR
jgi:hypothetical protein